jgi:integrase
MPCSDARPMGESSPAQAGTVTPGVGERTALSVNNYRRVYKRVVDKAAGLGHLHLRGPHDLRHTHAT